MDRRAQKCAACAVLAMLAAACGGTKSGADHIKSGDEFLAQGKLTPALIEYQGAVKADDRNGNARLKLGRTFAKVGDTKRAVDQLVRAADLLPNDSETQLEASRALLVVGRFEDARTRAEGVIQKDPKNVVAHVLRATATAGLKDTDGAINAMRETLKLDPTRSASYVDIATFQSLDGNAVEAEAAFKQAVVVDPKSVQARLALANFYLRAAKGKEAEQTLLEAIQLNPKHFGANATLAALYRLTNRSAQAEAPLKRMVEGATDPEPKLALADYYISERRPADARPILDELAKRKESAAAARSRLAGIEYETGKREVAHKMIDALIAEQPNNAEVRVVRGRWFLLEGKTREAAAEAKAAASMDAKSADAFALLGTVSVALRDADAANAAFTEQLKLQPNSVDAMVALANINVGRGRSEAAANFARQAVKLAPTSVAARYALARALLARGNTDEAQEQIKLVVAVAPDAPEVQHLVGLIEQRRGDSTSARRAFTRALEINPQSPEALTGLVALELTAGHSKAATDLVEKQMARSPQSASILLVAGQTYMQLGMFDRAELVLQKAISLDASQLDAYHVLAQAYVRQNKLDAARQTYEKRLAEKPNDVGAQTLVATILFSQGKAADARAGLEKALAIDPRAAVASNDLAYLDAEAGANLDIALNRAQIAKAALPDNPDVNDTLGWVYVKKSLPALAISPLEQAVQSRPSEPMYRYHLGVAHLKAGDKDRARAEISRALSLSASFPAAADAKRALDTLGQ